MLCNMGQFDWQSRPLHHDNGILFQPKAKGIIIRWWHRPKHMAQSRLRNKSVFARRLWAVLSVLSSCLLAPTTVFSRHAPLLHSSTSCRAYIMPTAPSALEHTSKTRKQVMARNAQREMTVHLHNSSSTLPSVTTAWLRGCHHQQHNCCCYF